MAQHGLRRYAFDPDMDFTCLKPFACNGIQFETGQSFDKTLVPVRRLRQMYDGRFIDGKLGAPKSKQPRPRAFGDFALPSDLLQKTEQQITETFGETPTIPPAGDRIALTADEFRALQRKPVERVRIKEEE